MQKKKPPTCLKLDFFGCGKSFFEVGKGAPRSRARTDTSFFFASAATKCEKRKEMNMLKKVYKT